MADQKNYQGEKPLAADVEVATLRSRNKRVKILAYIALFILVQISVRVALDLTIMSVKTPRYSLTSIAMEDLTVYSLKNPNFGPYKFYDSYITFFHRGKPVGEAAVREAKAKALSSKKVGFEVKVRSKMGSDTNGVALELRVESELRGQVHLMKVIKEDKYPAMACSLKVDLAGRVSRDLKCD